MEQAVRNDAEIQFDEHGIEPIPAADRDSTPLQQFWIWAGANIAPINWVLGALGIILGLSLVETILVVVIGNVIGCALFGLFCIMGSRTGVNQMVLSRAAFGRRGAYLPATAQMLMTMGWLGVNTWVVLDLVLGIFKEMGYDNPGTGTKYAVGIGIMAVQVVIAIVGFYLIQTFEKYTVPVAAAFMIVISILAWTKIGRRLESLDRQRRRQVDGDHAADDGDRRRLGDHLADVVVRLHALHQAGDAGPEGVLVDVAGRLHPDGVARPSSARRWRARPRTATRRPSSARRSAPASRSSCCSWSCTGRSRRTSSTSTRRRWQRCRSTSR